MGRVGVLGDVRLAHEAQLVLIPAAEGAPHPCGAAAAHGRFGRVGVLSRPQSDPTAGAVHRHWRVFHACPLDHLGRDALQRAAAPGAGHYRGDGRQRGLRRFQTQKGEVSLQS